MGDAQTCQFYVQRKKRYCKMLVKSGKRFCGQHQVEEPTENGSEAKRIPCPLDPKHSCYEHRLQLHLEVCNAKEVNDLPYISRNINLAKTGDDPSKTSLQSLTDDQLLSFIERVEVIHKEKIGDIERSRLSHEVLTKEISNPSYGPSVIRHLTQNSSLLGHLSRAGFLDTSASSTCFIEFGAGRGQLTHWLTESVTDTSKALFVLIDRGAQRYKFDAKLKYNKELFIQRLRVDIQHLLVEGIDRLNDYEKIVGFGKHLCGGATDLTLHCLARHKEPVSAGIVVALCCHHRCTWNTYVGDSFLQEVGFTPEEFYTLCALTSWATCNSKDVEKDNTATETDETASEEGNGITTANQEETVSHEKEEESGEKQVIENRYTRLCLSAQYREEVGRKAKQILDYGRVQYLNQQGFESRLVQYVNKEETLENIALLAFHKDWIKDK